MSRKSCLIRLFKTTVSCKLFTAIILSVFLGQPALTYAVIDVYPENFRYPREATEYLKNFGYPMSGYQQMVRGELFRGRFRTGFDNPQPFVPNEITPVNYTLYDVAHSFLPGHRLMIQIQSSWFPIIDRNPQKFIDTYHCTVEDFEMKQNIKIYHQEGAATRLLLPVVK